jgi:subtilisin family serine protease
MKFNKNIIKNVSLTTLFLLTLPSNLLLAISQNSEEELNFKAAELAVSEKLKQPHEKNSLIVKFKDNISTEEAIGAANSVAINKAIGPNRFNNTNLHLIKADSEEDLKEKLIQFEMDDRVEEVIPNYIFSAAWDSTTGKPVDFDDSKHWYHLKTNLPEVYKLQGCGTENDAACGGSSDVVVAVLDSGLAFEDYNANFTYWDTNYQLDFDPAPETTGINLWTNEGESYGSGDNDVNEYCDDLHGVDMVQAYENNWLIDSYEDFQDQCLNTTNMQKEGHPNDDNGHGTFVTGIISSLTDNQAGTSFGIAPNVTIMPVKILNYEGYTNLSVVLQGIYYAVEEGADIINLSIQGTDPTGFLRDAIIYARNNNVLIVGASGNGGSDNIGDPVVSHPAAYSGEFDNVIAVGASTPSDTRSVYSNYGPNLDLVAPVGQSNSEGNGIWQETFSGSSSWGNVPLESRNFSTFSHRYWIGTSFAAPQVSAAAAILKSKNPMEYPSGIKHILKMSATKPGFEWFDQQLGYGILNTQTAYNVTWQAWTRSGATSDIVTMKALNNKLFQAIRGIDNIAYVRYYDNTSSTWTDWVRSGSTVKEVSMEVVGNKLFVAIPGIDSYVRTRYFDDDTDTWSDWVRSGATSDIVTMKALNNKLFQATRGIDNFIRTRIYDNEKSLWYPWVLSGSSVKQVTLDYIDSKMFMTAPGTDINVRIRYYQ